MNIVVTGANKGLGFYLTRAFAGNGHQVLAGVFAGEDAAALQALAVSHPGRVRLVPLDVTDELSVNAAAEEACNYFGRVDVLIGNAGVLLIGDRTNTLYDLDIGELQRSIAVNTIGTVIPMKCFLPVMRDDGEGMMIFITSEAGSVSSSGSNFPAYSISKTAANKAVFILRATVGNKYKVYAMHPGRMNTDMGHTTAQIEPEKAAEGIYRIAVGTATIKDNGTGFINYKGETMPL
jgi:NAD(P)-dependent dehydrogenase (short-subunit alcohol dehydrogenase family)